MGRAARAAATTALVVGLAACGDGDGSTTSAADAAVTRTPPTTDLLAVDPPATDPPGPPNGAEATPDEAADDAQVVELAYADGEVTTGAGRVAVDAGRVLRLEVTSDVDEEVHVHGFDLEVPVTAGERTTIGLVADLPGVWEVELHEAEVVLVELEIAG